MTKPTIEDLIIDLINLNYGLKGAELSLKVMAKDLTMTNNEILDTIFTMIEQGDLVEVEYILPGNHTSKSFVLPKGTHINIINKTRVK